MLNKRALPGSSKTVNVPGFKWEVSLCSMDGLAASLMPSELDLKPETASMAGPVPRTRPRAGMSLGVFHISNFQESSRVCLDGS